jgi:alcohol dehydrogenase, propanol-preferring
MERDGATCYLYSHARRQSGQAVKAWVVSHPGPIEARGFGGVPRGDSPLALIEREDPSPRPGEVRVRVSTCGVCRTDLHLALGELAPRRPGVIPGHEVVGLVDACGPGVSRFEPGQRIGIPWLRSTCGRCRFCLRGDENLCVEPRFTGWDEDGGYAEYAVVDEDYAYALPDAFDDQHAAPLLCAGIIGYRALRRAALPARQGGRLGIYGFGASAHLATQIALHEGATVHVLTRSVEAQRLALELGATSVGDPHDGPPEPLDSAVLFAPAGGLVPLALAALDRGGTLAVAGIHLSDVPPLRYQEHLFQERNLRSVTANTRRDGEEFLALAARIPVRVETVTYPFERADAALADLAQGRVTGVAVITLSDALSPLGGPSR